PQKDTTTTAPRQTFGGPPESHQSRASAIHPALPRTLADARRPCEAERAYVRGGAGGARSLLARAHASAAAVRGRSPAPPWREARVAKPPLADRPSSKGNAPSRAPRRERPESSSTSDHATTLAA